MENASKALLIAGAILIAMLTIGLLVYLTNNMNIIAQNREEQIKQTQLLKFNDQYEAYNKKILYGADVLTVYNKATENNNKLEESYYQITIDIVNIAGTPYIINWDDIMLNPNSNNARIFKTSIFECIEVTYNDITGRVETMKFQEISTADVI